MSVQTVHYFAAHDGGYIKDGVAFLTPCGLGPGAKAKRGQRPVRTTDDPAQVTCPYDCARAANERRAILAKREARESNA